jgi:protein-tyrosine-phosphatase
MNTTPFTRSVLVEKNVDLGEHLPRRFRDVNPKSFDLIVNLSGSPMPRSLGVAIEDWNVDDPMGKSEEEFRQTREIIEMLVMRLILRARLGKI